MNEGPYIEPTINADSADKSPFDNFPEEVIGNIISFLPLNALSKLYLTNSTWNRLAKEKSLFRQHIQTYFPYLKYTQTELFINDPLNLFKRELDSWRTMIIPQPAFIKLRGSLISLTELLASLRGDIFEAPDETPPLDDEYLENILADTPAVEGEADAPAAEGEADVYSDDEESLLQNSELHEQSKLAELRKQKIQKLYSFAVANGHFRFLEKLEDGGAFALHVAIKNNYSTVALKLSREQENKISYQNRVKALHIAATVGNLELVQQIADDFNNNPLYKSESVNLDKQKALADAVSRKHIPIIDYFLKTSVFPGNFKGKVLKETAKNGVFLFIGTLLKNITEIPPCDIQEALSNCVKWNSYDSVKLILQQAADANMTHENLYIGNAYTKAIWRGFFDIFEYMLKSKFHRDSMGMALVWAASANQMKIIDYLLSQCKQDMSAYVQGSALVIALERGFTQAASLILQLATDISAEDKIKAKKIATIGDFPEILSSIEASLSTKDSTLDNTHAIDDNIPRKTLKK